jgi:hypothetical protein
VELERRGSVNKRSVKRTQSARERGDSIV